MRSKMIIAGMLVGVVAILFLELCTFVAKPYQTVLLNRFGKIIAKPTRIAYNWYLCWPTDGIIRLDNRLHLYQSANREVTTRAGEPIAIRSFALWHIVNPVLYYQRLPGGTPEVQRYLEQKIDGTVLKVMGQYTLDQMFNVDAAKIKMRQAEQQVKTAVDRQMEPLGLQVVQVGFSRMTFPPSVALQVYDRMSAEREKIASRYLSEGQSQAQAIVAQGEEQAAEIRSKAEETAAAIRGQGDAEAYAILNQAQRTKQARAFYRFWKSLQLFKNSMGRSTYWVLTPENPVTAPLFDQWRKLELGGLPATAGAAPAGAVTDAPRATEPVARPTPGKP
jgi:membrane protease subunit HflC